MEKNTAAPTIDQEFYFQWHITDKCNKRCRHCYHSSYGSNELSENELTEVVDKIIQASNAWEKPITLSLTGGEPFIRRKELFHIMEKLHNYDCISHYDILTNGSLITPEDCMEMKKFPLLRRVQLSLEGSSPSINDSIRGNGSFNEVINSIKLLKKYDFTVGIMMTVSRKNMHDIDGVLTLLQELNVDTFAFERFIPEGSGAGMRDEILMAGELKYVENKMYEWSLKHNRPHVLLFRPLMCLLDPDSRNIGAMCSVGMNALSIMPDGTLLPCRRLPIPIGNILHDSIHDVWMQTPLLWQARNPKSYKGKCRDCSYLPTCRGCRAQAYAITGDWLAEDPQCWLEQ